MTERILIDIATTGGPATVRAAEYDEEARRSSMVLYDRNYVSAGVDQHFDAFDRKLRARLGQAGLTVPEGGLILEVSEPIDTGESWQLGLCAVHAALAAGALETEDHAAARLVWATGALRTSSWATRAVEAVPLKLALSAGRLEAFLARGVPVDVLVPEEQLAEAEAAAPAGVRLHAVGSVAEVPELLGLAAAPVRPVSAEPRRGRTGRFWAGAGVGVAALAGLGLWAALPGDPAPPQDRTAERAEPAPETPPEMAVVRPLSVARHPALTAEAGPDLPVPPRVETPSGLSAPAAGDRPPRRASYRDGLVPLGYARRLERAQGPGRPGDPPPPPGSPTPAPPPGALAALQAPAPGGWHRPANLPATVGRLGPARPETRALAPPATKAPGAIAAVPRAVARAPAASRAPEPARRLEPPHGLARTDVPATPRARARPQEAPRPAHRPATPAAPALGDPREPRPLAIPNRVAGPGEARPARAPLVAQRRAPSVTPLPTRPPLGDAPAAPRPTVPGQPPAVLAAARTTPRPYAPSAPSAPSALEPAPALWPALRGIEGGPAPSPVDAAAIRNRSIWGADIATPPLVAELLRTDGLLDCARFAMTGGDLRRETLPLSSLEIDVAVVPTLCGLDLRPTGAAPLRLAPRLDPPNAPGLRLLPGFETETLRLRVAPERLRAPVRLSLAIALSSGEVLPLEIRFLPEGVRPPDAPQPPAARWFDAAEPPAAGDAPAPRPAPGGRFPAGWNELP